MRTFPSINLASFKNAEERTQIKVMSDMLRQVSGGLSRSILPGTSPAAAIVIEPPGGGGLPTPSAGALLYGLGTTWGILPVGAASTVLTVSGGLPVWVAPSAVDIARTWSTLQTFKDSAFLVGAAADVTKAFVLSLGGATAGKTLTLISSHTDNRSITLPNATTTLAGLSVAQTFTKPIVIDNDTATDVLLKLVPHASQSVDMFHVRDSGDSVNYLGVDSGGNFGIGWAAFTVGALTGSTCTLDFSSATLPRSYAFPDATGTMVMSGFLATILANVSSILSTDTIISGATFADNTDTSKRLRFITSGCLTNTQNAIAFTSTAARTWLMPDQAGVIISEAGVVNLVGQTSSIGSTAIFTPPSYTVPFTVASCTKTSGSPAIGSSAGFGSVVSGMLVTGTGIPDNTYVVNKISTSSIRLSRNATDSTTVTLTFSAVGMYQISVYMTCTTAGDAGDNVALNLSWNDGTAAQTFNSFVTLLMTTVNTRANGIYNFVANASAVSYSTTLTSPGAGTPAYTLYLRVTAL